MDLWKISSRHMEALTSFDADHVIIFNHRLRPLYKTRDLYALLLQRFTRQLKTLVWVLLQFQM